MRISDWSSDVCSSDLWQDWTVTLETDEEATFKAGQFRTARPKQDDSGRIERPLRIDAADPSIVRKLLALTAMQETVQCTFRIYLSDDLTAPVLAPEITSLGGFSYAGTTRSEEHTSELQSLMRNSSAVFCLQKKQQPVELHR